MKEKMKNTIKRVLSLFAAIAMVLGVMSANVTPVVAANDGSITIRNTTKDATYTVYKIFDATYSGNNVSYTYDGSNTAFLSALKEDSSPFNVEGSTAPYVITKKTEAEDSAVVSFIRDHASEFGNAVATATGNGSEVTINGLAYGYYYITTTTGSTATITSAVKDALIIDKNENFVGPDKTESTGNYHDVDEANAKIGDTITYKVTGTIRRYKGETPVSNIILEDTLSDGLTRGSNLSITVQGPNDTTSKSLAINTDYTFSTNGQVLTITIPTVTGEAGHQSFKYESGTIYTVTYDAILNSRALVGHFDPTNTNTVVAKYNNNIRIGEDTTKVYTYEIGLTKVDQNSHMLTGAKFRLYDAQTDGNEIPVVLANTLSSGTKVYRKAVANETGVEMEVGINGALAVQGLNNGDYYFEETQAPEGFNPLTERQKVTINDKNATINVVNSTGTVLPSTGGIGTTIFYVIGGMIVAGAIVLLIARRRKNA